jgi:hypothetical protein
MIRPVPCRVGFCRLDHDYCEDTDTEQIGGVHNLIQYVDTDTVIGYGDRIGQMIMSGPALRGRVMDNSLSREKPKCLTGRRVGGQVV